MYDGFRVIDIPRKSEPKTFGYSRVVDDTRTIINMARLFLRISQPNSDIAKDAYVLFEHVENYCRRLSGDGRDSDWDLVARIATESLPRFEFAMDGVFKRRSYYSLYLLSKIRI